MPIDYLAKRPRLACDTECFPNFWMIGFRDVETHKIVKIGMREGEELDRARIAQILRHHRIYTFNGINYDLPMIAYAMKGASPEQLKTANDAIILGGLKHWEFYDRFGCAMPEFLDHVDLMEVAPAAAQRFSLKKYAGTMHSRTMMEFLHDFDTPLTDDGIQQAKDYLNNDLEVTCDLIEELTPLVDIREKVSEQIGVDVRSKSNAQIGEAIVKQRVEQRLGKRIYKPDIVKGTFKYEAPAYVKFKTLEMQAMLERLLRANFLVKSDGYVELPEIFGKKKGKDVDATADDENLEGGSEIIIGGNVYKMGIGGLHSQEKSISHYSDDDHDLVDSDVTGYYPNLMVKSGREPDNMRGHFLPVFTDIKVQREKDKAAGRKDEAETGKIATNGLFGKTGSPYSIVYSPRMMIQTTVTGQLSLLMLIEDFTLRGWRVISANTDGVVTRVPKDDHEIYKAVIAHWEKACGLQMEFTYYRSVHSRDVNSYFALKYKQDREGFYTGEIEVKRKGAFAPSGRGQPASFGLKKTPDVEICYDAAIDYVLNGTSVESTVRNCQDIRKFVTVRRVTGGAATESGEMIGKVVRFYYSVFVKSPLLYSTNGNRVPSSMGAQPCMTLPDELPGDIDYEWYERETYAILDEAGLDVIDPTLVGRTGTTLARREDQKTIHTIELSTGLALCGLARKSRREPWVEYSAMPDGLRYCSKCRKEDEL